MGQVGLWINHSKIEAKTLAVELTQWFRLKGWEVYSEWEEIKTKGVDFLISLGGDGTLLEASREAAPYEIPVLGVNLGRLGFLCEIERNEVYLALQKVLDKQYKIQERLMLSATIQGKDLAKDNYLVLNDVVFSRNLEGIITLQANISGEPSIRYPSDGLIIATPTGSTAYSLSAGGPIMSPDVDAFLITPLAAHSLSARPMVVSQDDQVEVFVARGKECLVTFDGKDRIPLMFGQSVQIQKAPLKALLIRLGKRSFPSVVREKLRDRWHE